MKKLSKALQTYFGDRLPLGESIGSVGSGWRHLTLSKMKSRALDLLPLLRISRVADLTPLDEIGVSTIVLCIPGERHGENYCCGKASTFDGALVSAAMEAYEYRSIRSRHVPLLRGLTTKEASRFGKVVNPNDIGYPVTKKTERSARLEWIKVLELNSAEEFYLPADLFLFRKIKSNVRVNPFPSTSGGAAGGGIYETILHAIFELVERDSFILSLFNPGRRLEICETNFDKSNWKLIQNIISLGKEIYIFDITTDIGIPTYEFVMIEDANSKSSHRHVGRGCHLDPQIAILRAIEEACQVRLTFFSGARNDVASGLVPNEKIEQERRVFREGEFAPVARAIVRPGASFKPHLKRALKHLSAAGLSDVYVANLSHPESDIPYTHAYIPGLEVISFQDDFVTIGPRAMKFEKLWQKTE